MKFFYSKKIIFFVFAVSILFSAVFLLFFRTVGPAEHAEPGTDYRVYYEPIANNIIEGKGIVSKYGNMPLNIGPGYPIYLSLVFIMSKAGGVDKFLLITLFNVLIAAFSCCFLFLIAENIFDRKIAIFSSLLWASYPFNLWLLKNPNTEVPFIFFFFLAILFYILSIKKEKFFYAFLAGLFISAATAVRIISLFLPVLFVLFFFLFLKKKKALLFSLFLVIGCLVIFGPWAGYSFYKNGGFISISEQGPENILSGVNWLAEPGKREIVSEDVTLLIEKMNKESLSGFGDTAGFFIQEFVQRPAPVLKIIWLKATRTWYGTSSRWREEPLVLAIQLFYIITALFGLRIAFKERKKDVLFIAFFLSVILFFWGMTFLAVSIMRYMIPVMALVIIFSAVTVDFLINKLYGKIRFNHNTMQK
jgi:4-amino-4-deoxy-L-arabinose transferase-like glycosyltransferase